MPENPFQDDKPIPDPNTPPPNRDTYYKPYWKKNGTTAAVPARAPTPATAPVKLDPYAVAPPVHIHVKPVQPAAKVAIRQPAPVTEVATVKMASAEEIAPVSLHISDDLPPAPPMILPASTAKRIELSVPANPLR